MPAYLSPNASRALARSQYPAPFQLNDEYAADEVINLAAIPGDVIRERGAPVPQMLMPPRYGYNRTPLTITDVLSTDRWAPTFRSWTSGSAAIPPPIERNGFSGSDGAITKNALIGGVYGQSD